MVPKGRLINITKTDLEHSIRYLQYAIEALHAMNKSTKARNQIRLINNHINKLKKLNP